MVTIYYSYHYFTDSLGNNISPSHQAQNYPELFNMVPASGVEIVEGQVPDEKYKDGSKIGFLRIPEEILTATGLTTNYIEQILIRLGGVFSLYIIADVAFWLSEYTTLSEEEITKFIGNSK